jgi:thiosulfate reductase / polysulfide reductase chain A
MSHSLTGEVVYRSACRMCHGGCGTLVHVKDGIITKIVGDPESPISKGSLCVKGQSSLGLVYHSDRLKYPVIRRGERGEGNWHRISWDEALNKICERLKDIKEKYGAEAIALGQGTGRHHYHFIPRFANAFGTPNWCEPGFAQCLLPRFKVSRLTYGDFFVCDYYGEIKPKCILFWGHNPLVSGPDGEIASRVKEYIDKGHPKLIVVDPRLTKLANKADIWLQLRPGTDDALALGILNVIIAEELYDKEFVDKWTFGFEKLIERVKEYPPELCEKITWVPVKKIREAARLYAMTKPACVDWGCAIEQTPKAIQTVRAIAILPALTGNIDQPGGNIFGMHIIRNVPSCLNKLPPIMWEKRLGANKFKLLGGFDKTMPSAHIPSLFEAICTGKPYPIKALLIFGNNALVTYANSKKVFEALMKLEFLVVTDIFMTPTAALADMVLPAATWLEVDQVVGLPIAADNVVLVQQKIIEMWECKQDEWILTELARRLNLDSAIEPLEEVYNYQLKPLGLTFKQLKQKGHISVPIIYKKFEKDGFKTPSGKIELYSSILEKLGYDPLPYYKEPPESPLSTPHIAKQYPLILTTGGRVLSYFNSEFRQITALRKAHPDPLVEIHPETAKNYGIADKDWVWIETLRGRTKQKAMLTLGIDPRVVHIEHGWWYPEKTGPDYGLWESNANILTNSCGPYDPAMGTYQLRALLCKVYKF